MALSPRPPVPSWIAHQLGVGQRRCAERGKPLPRPLVGGERGHRQSSDRLGLSGHAFRHRSPTCSGGLVGARGKSGYGLRHAQILGEPAPFHGHFRELVEASGSPGISSSARRWVILRIVEHRVCRVHVRNLTGEFGRSAPRPARRALPLPTMTAVHPTQAAELAHLGMQVTPENVVQVANVLRAEADYLREHLGAARRNSHVGEPGEDPVSPRAAKAFNAKIGAMYDRVDEYVDTLQSYADRLTATARDYGNTDEAIRRSFDTIRTGYGSTIPKPPLMTPPAHSPEATILRPYLPPPTIAPAPLAGPGPLLREPPSDDGWVPLVRLDRNR